MSRKAQWAFFVSVWGLAAVIGHLASGSRTFGAPANGLKCDDASPRNCYCRSDVPNKTSCYATGGPFYTCTTGQPKDSCDPTKATVGCGGTLQNPTGDNYTGLCTASGGPGAGQTKVGKCYYPEGSCK